MLMCADEKRNKDIVKMLPDIGAVNFINRSICCRMMLTHVRDALKKCLFGSLRSWGWGDLVKLLKRCGAIKQIFPIKQGAILRCCA